jgi:hypothetical protein
MSGYGMRRSDSKTGSVLLAIILALVILSDIAGFAPLFSAESAGAAATVIGGTHSGYIEALAELPADFGPPSPGPTDPNGPFPGP